MSFYKKAKDSGIDGMRNKLSSIMPAKKSIAKKMKHKSMASKGGFIERLEAHKAEGNSFDNGTWKPTRKGESFIQALERHKAADNDEFR